MGLLAEVVGQILFSFTRGVTEHYNPEEPEFTEESFGYNPLESTGREWYCRPVDELIYQEYSERESTTWDYLASRNLDIKVINACSIEEITQEDRKKDKAMAWKLLRPSVLCTVGKSLSTGALISLLAATFIGTLYTVICYACFNLLSTVNCGSKSNRLQTQWAFSGTLYCSFLYIWPFTVLLFLFRPFQLKGVKGKLFLVSFLSYCLDALYRVFLRALKLSHVSISSFLTWFPLNTIFIISVCLEQYVVTNHFCLRSRKIKKLILFLQMLATACFTFLLGQIGQYFVYPYYVKSKNKLLLALFFPLIGVVVKIISRICVQRLYNITHPGYSYTLLVPLYYGSAIIFRALQADLDSLENIAIVGIIHGAAEVIERSTMVFIDHIFYLLWKRKSAPWGSFRTPRRERLMADIAIMSMMSESTAIVSVNGFIYLFKFLCLQDSSLLMVLLLFAKFTLVQLVIEWFFTSVSLAIETRYQNLAVMAVWGRRWKRHILVAVVNIIPLAVYTSEDLSQLVSGQPGDT